MKSSSNFWAKAVSARSLLVLTGILILAVALCAVRPVGTSAANGNTAPSLRAALHLIGQGYCGETGENQDVGRADFRLHIEIHNESKEPVILCRKYIGVWTPVLHNVKSDGSVGDIAYKIEPDTFGIFDRDYPKDLKDYEVIQSGKAFDLDVTTDVLFRLGRNVGVGVPSPGNYFLRVELQTWDGPPGAPAELRERWRRYGYLFDGFVESDLIPVQIAPPGDLLYCTYRPRIRANVANR